MEPTNREAEANRDPEIARQTRPIPEPLRRQASWFGAMTRGDTAALFIGAGVALLFVFPPAGVALVVIGLFVFGLFLAGKGRR